MIQRQRQLQQCVRVTIHSEVSFASVAKSNVFIIGKPSKDNRFIVLSLHSASIQSLHTRQWILTSRTCCQASVPFDCPALICCTSCRRRQKSLTKRTTPPPFDLRSTQPLSNDRSMQNGKQMNSEFVSPVLWLSSPVPEKRYKTIVLTVNQTLPEFCFQREDQYKHECNFCALASKYTGSGTEAQALPHTLRPIKQMRKNSLSNVGQAHKSKQQHKDTVLTPNAGHQDHPCSCPRT